ncbi:MULTISPECIES: hypothetical protein [Pseudomonas]|uniref:hypothetical protein n=1 Tax=Pseudomonas TaxID=286 RepID=UPI001EDDA330|nr:MULTISPECIES: hypothetical protein [Pseudomonas]MDR9863559.1 hypothetical protein [Pseudomonas baetica]
MDPGLPSCAGRPTPSASDPSPQAGRRPVARGRNNWIVWTAGNDALWDELSRDSVGNLDLLKTISNHPSLAYNDSKLVKPYRVGMSCGFCHVGPNPTNPPADPKHPAWSNLNSNPRAHYFWVDRIFMWKQDKSSFPFQLFHTSKPGALDTSFVSTDYINNPRTMTTTSRRAWSWPGIRARSSSPAAG